MRIFLFRTFFIILSVSSVLFNSCTKIDTTTIGSDLIPAVDNIHTFADTLEINGVQGIFDDSTRLGRSDYHMLGSISNDPVFGGSHADCYLQLKPTFFPYHFGNANDTINNLLAPGTGFDSVVLCVSVKGFYGDSTKAQKFSVYQINPFTSNFKDSAYKLNFVPDAPLTNLIGQATVVPQEVKQFVKFPSKNIPDSVNYQVRIKLSPVFLNTLVANLDTTTAGSANNIYRSDSIFQTLMKGFAIKTDRDLNSNGLFYTSLADAKTRLEVHFRRKNNNKIDTTFSSFYFASSAFSGIQISPCATHFERDRSGSEIASLPQADALYIQTTPGSFATLTIPRLSSLDNRIVHRAEIIVDQFPSSNSAIAAVDAVLPPPSFLYLDLVDTPSTANKFKTIYFDLNPNAYYNPDNGVSYLPSNGIDFTYFGGFLRKRVDPITNTTAAYYNFNVTRYVQQLVTKRTTNYQMRLYAPYNLSYGGYLFSFQNSLSYGRIKIGNGNNANYKLRMRIVYSKI